MAFGLPSRTCLLFVLALLCSFGHSIHLSPPKPKATKVADTNVAMKAKHVAAKPPPAIAKHVGLPAGINSPAIAKHHSATAVKKAMPKTAAAAAHPTHVVKKAPVAATAAKAKPNPTASINIGKASTDFLRVNGDQLTLTFSALVVLTIGFILLGVVVGYVAFRYSATHEFKEESYAAVYDIE